MVSQMVLTDNCQNFWFAVAQLNTIAINIDVEGIFLPFKIAYIFNCNWCLTNWFPCYYKTDLRMIRKENVFEAKELETE